MDRVRVNFDFPKENYKQLKVLCASRGLTLRHYISEILFQALKKDSALEIKNESRIGR